MRLAQSPRELSLPVPHMRCAEVGQLWLNPIMSNVPASASHTADDRATPVAYADERNLRKRRNSRQVEVAETPGPKWEGGGHTGSFLSYGLSLIRSA